MAPDREGDVVTGINRAVNIEGVRRPAMRRLLEKLRLVPRSPEDLRGYIAEYGLLRAQGPVVFERPRELQKEA